MSRHNRNLLSGIVALSVVVRILAAFYLGDTLQGLPGIADQYSYHTLAERVVEGHGFTFGELWWPLTRAGEPTAHWSYLYTLYLAGVYSLFGATPIAARLIQVIIVGILQPILTFQLGRLAFDERVGLAAAGWSAIYIYFVYYAAALMTEAFYITAILAGLYIVIRAMQSMDPQGRLGAHSRFKSISPWVAWLGITLGVAILLRQVMLLILPILFLWVFWWKKWQSTPFILGVLAVVGIMILPITLFNLTRFEEFVLLNTNAGFAFFWANHPIYGSQFIPILPTRMSSYANLIPAELRHLGEAALDRALLQRGFQFVIEDPIRYVQLTVSRIPVLFQVLPSTDSSALSNISRVMSFGLLLPFTLIGLVQSALDWGHATVEQKRIRVMLLGFTTAYVMIHLLSWALIRYRLPVDAVMILFASVGLFTVIGWWSRKTSQDAPAPSV